MVQFKVNEIKQFVTDLKDPDKLLRGCKKFFEIEPRDIIYLVSRKLILENPESNYHIMAGIKVLLLTWNAVYLQRQPEKVKRSLEDDILKAYRKSKDDFDYLAEERLETVDLRDPDISGKIKNIFQIFRRFRSIETTGASKAIHLINPVLFMMWDYEIKTNYHRIHPFFRYKAETPAECYFQFMNNMQEVARAILTQKPIDEIWKKHPIHIKDPEVIKIFSEAAMKSLPKMLDECNYVKFRRGLDY